MASSTLLLPEPLRPACEAERGIGGGGWRLAVAAAAAELRRRRGWRRKAGRRYAPQGHAPVMALNEASKPLTTVRVA